MIEKRKRGQYLLQEDENTGSGVWMDVKATTCANTDRHTLLSVGRQHGARVYSAQQRTERERKTDS